MGMACKLLCDNEAGGWVRSREQAQDGPFEIGELLRRMPLARNEEIGGDAQQNALRFDALRARQGIDEGQGGRLVIRHLRTRSINDDVERTELP